MILVRLSEVASTIYSNSYYEMSYLVRSRPRVPIDVTVSVRPDAQLQLQVHYGSYGSMIYIDSAPGVGIITAS